jgi:methionine aminopeptidase
VIVMQALNAAIAAVKPGVRFRDLGNVISSHVKARG